MPWENEYRRILIEGREQSLRTMPRLMRLALARIYVAQMDGVLTQYELEEITENGAGRLIEDLGRALVRVASLSELSVKRQIMQVLQQVQANHEKAWAAAVDATGVGIHASFSGLPADAFEAMFVRRGIGLTQSYKTLTKHSAQASAKLVEDALTQMVARGESYRQATQRIARALATGDEYLEKVVVQRGSRGGLKRWARGVDPDETSASVARKIGFDARRIAITEAAAAYNEGDRIGAMQSPAIEGMKRNLSHRHPEKDECDLLVEADYYGLGPGVYPSEAAISNTHPFCMCYWTFVTRPVSQWDRPKPRPDRPRQVSEAEAKSLGVDAAALKEANEQTRRAYSFWSERRLAA